MCYRYEQITARSEIQFHQVEGLAVGRHITMTDLKGTLISFAHRMFGANRKVRFRASYFPFTEPSAEMDVECLICGGSGCGICKQSGWLEILGCGMVHPRVLQNGGYDPAVFSGFAFGMGPERITMLLHRIDDIRFFWGERPPLPGAVLSGGAQPGRPTPGSAPETEDTMRVPISWLKEFVDIPIPIHDLAERLTFAGLEVASVETVGLPGSELPWDRERMVVGRVREVVAHPNADRLVLATVEYGPDQVKTVVTGAPNLKVGDSRPEGGLCPGGGPALGCLRRDARRSPR